MDYKNRLVFQDTEGLIEYDEVTTEQIGDDDSHLDLWGLQITPATKTASQTDSNTIFVNTTGDDSTGDGTEANPYLTVNKAVQEFLDQASYTLKYINLSGDFNYKCTDYDYFAILDFYTDDTSTVSFIKRTIPATIDKWVDLESGDDSTGDGSSSLPYKTIQTALDDLVSGGSAGNIAVRVSEDYHTAEEWLSYIYDSGNASTMIFPVAKNYDGTDATDEYCPKLIIKPGSTSQSIRDVYSYTEGGSVDDYFFFGLSRNRVGNDNIQEFIHTWNRTDSAKSVLTLDADLGGVATTYDAPLSCDRVSNFADYVDDNGSTITFAGVEKASSGISTASVWSLQDDDYVELYYETDVTDGNGPTVRLTRCDGYTTCLIYLERSSGNIDIEVWTLEDYLHFGWAENWNEETPSLTNLDETMNEQGGFCLNNGRFIFNTHENLYIASPNYYIKKPISYPAGITRLNYILQFDDSNTVYGLAMDHSTSLDPLLGYSTSLNNILVEIDTYTGYVTYVSEIFSRSYVSKKIQGVLKNGNIYYLVVIYSREAGDDEMEIIELRSDLTTRLICELTLDGHNDSYTFGVYKGNLIFMGYDSSSMDLKAVNLANIAATGGLYLQGCSLEDAGQSVEADYFSMKYSTIRDCYQGVNILQSPAIESSDVYYGFDNTILKDIDHDSLKLYNKAPDLNYIAFDDVGGCIDYDPVGNTNELTADQLSIANASYFLKIGERDTGTASSVSNSIISHVGLLVNSYEDDEVSFENCVLPPYPIGYNYTQDSDCINAAPIYRNIDDDLRLQNTKVQTSSGKYYMLDSPGVGDSDNTDTPDGKNTDWSDYTSTSEDIGCYTAFTPRYDRSEPDETVLIPTSMNLAYSSSSIINKALDGTAYKSSGEFKRTWDFSWSKNFTEAGTNEIFNEMYRIRYLKGKSSKLKMWFCKPTFSNSYADEAAWTGSTEYDLLVNGKLGYYSGEMAIDTLTATLPKTMIEGQFDGLYLIIVENPTSYPGAPVISEYKIASSTSTTLTLEDVWDYGDIASDDYLFFIGYALVYTGADDLTGSKDVFDGLNQTESGPIAGFKMKVIEA